MRPSRRRLATFVALLLLAACVSTQATRLGGGPLRPPVPPDQVVIYRTAAQVPGQYEEVGLLSSSGDHSFTSEEQMWASMRKKAGELGANAIILDAMSEPSAGAQVAQAVFGTSAKRRGKAVAIFLVPRDTTAQE